MKKFTSICLTALAAVLFLMGCNSTVRTVEEEMTPNVGIYGFSLAPDDSVLANLDTVFFSINLVTANIFNADSLPYGTKVTALTPRITTYYVEEINLKVTLASGVDTVYKYDRATFTDTIDFTHPVTVSVKSYDGMVTRDYTVKVNVHTAKTDSLVWNKAAKRTLPTNLESPTESRTVRTNKAFYCLTTDGVDTCMATTDDVYAGNWQMAKVSLPAGSRIETLSAHGDNIYVIAGSTLMESADGGANWTSTGLIWTNIYGSVGSALLGNVNDGGTWRYTSYPGGGCDGVAMPASMPVSGTSQLVPFTFPMSGEMQAIMVGGQLADGSLTGAVWAYDGRNWDMLNSNYAHPAKGISLVPFYVYKVSSLFVATEESVIMAFCGTDEEKMYRTVYTTSNFGLSWKIAGELMQLPSYVLSFSDAQTFLETATLGDARSLSMWQPLPIFGRIPGGVDLEMPYIKGIDAFATRPVTTWECPFIYTFGGKNLEGELNNVVWRATLNRLVFKPIQ